MNTITAAPPLSIPLNLERPIGSFQNPFSRSPTSSSSMSSYRSHPYPPRLSPHPRSPTSTGDMVPRIHLPAPNSTAPLHVGLDNPSNPLTSGTSSNPTWRNDPPRPSASSTRGITLPPLHSTLSDPTALIPTASMAPPLLTSPIYASSSLRPSYVGYEGSIQSQAPAQPTQGARWKEDPYGGPRSPPLRALPSPRAFSPDRYLPPAHPSLMRSRSQSTVSRRSEDLEGGSREGGIGQNRRMAHLMSEQKRREYVRSICPEDTLRPS